MSLTIIIFLILISIVLLIVELLIVPGITIAGIGSFILMVISIYFAYRFHGNQTGNYVLFAGLGTAFITLVFSLRTSTWKNVGLKSIIDGKIITFEKDKIKEGDTGKTITRLAPIGKAIVNDVICEAKSHADFINENTEIVVLKIKNNQIIVKPKNI